MVVNEFLPMDVGQAMVDDVTRQGRRFFRPNSGAVMPLEFQGAAYRFGHSMVRPSCRANVAGDNDAPFFGFIFDPGNTDPFDPDDMVGGFRACSRPGSGRKASPRTNGRLYRETSCALRGPGCRP